jgi:predicted RNase H-like nuclease (RuvC/YqgF family)
MREVMQNASGIDVSKEEEQFLRKAFRRFALPYVLVVALVAVVASTVLSNEAPAGSPQDVSALREKITALEQSVAALETQLAKVDGELAKAGTRVGALESRKPAAVAESTDTSALERALRDATRRVADLERRSNSSASAAERIDALVARMQRIEGASRASAAPAPVAPAPAPMPAAPAPAPAP